MAFRPLPTKAQFKKSFGTGTLVKSTPAGPLKSIGRALELAQNLLLMNSVLNRARVHWAIDCLITQALADQRGSGLAGKQDKVLQLIELQKQVRGNLQVYFNARNWETTRQHIADALEVDNKHAQQDIRNLVYYMSTRERAAFRLVFRNGRCFRYSNGQPSVLIPYDTDGEAADGQYAGMNILEFGAAPFVLSSSGRLYITGQDLAKGDFKHTSFMAGDDVLAAGTLRAEKGYIRWISAKSGHYQPKAQHMLNLFDMLMAHGVRVENLLFYRVRLGGQIRGTPDREFEECRAIDFIRHRGFPGPNPQEMFIPPPPAQPRV